MYARFLYITWKQRNHHHPGHPHNSDTLSQPTSIIWHHWTWGLYGTGRRTKKNTSTPGESRLYWTEWVHRKQCMLSPDECEELDLERHRYAMYILTQIDRPIPSQEERDAVLAKPIPQINSYDVPNLLPLSAPTLTPNGLFSFGPDLPATSISSLDSRISAVKSRISEAKEDQFRDLERIYDYHGALMKSEEVDMWYSWDCEFPELPKLYELNGNPHPRQAELPFDLHTSVACSANTSTIRTFTDDISRFKYTYFKNTLLPLAKELNLLEKQKYWILQVTEENKRKEEDHKKRKQELEETAAKHLQAQQEISRREEQFNREKQFPQDGEDFLNRNKDTRTRVARILWAFYPVDPAQVEVENSATPRAGETLLQEGSWNRAETLALGSLWAHDAQLKDEVTERVREYEDTRTRDPRRRLEG